MSTPNLAYYWKKKEFISYLLSVLVFLIHISSFSQHENNRSIISVINSATAYFFKESITRFAVPLFFILSGASFFRNYTNAVYLSKLKARVHSLLIPYLLWNTLWMLFDIVCSHTFLSAYFIGREPFKLSFISLLRGIFFYGSNLPFWFIFNTIVFVIASPLINLIISSKPIAFASLGCIILLRLFGIHLPTNIFFDPDSILFYLTGAIIGKHYFEQFTQKSHKQIQYIAAVFLGLYVVLKNIYHPTNHFFTPIVNFFVLCFCSFSLWSLVDLFVDRMKMKPFLSKSFAIYAMHTNVSAIITKLFALAFRKNEYFAIPNFLFTLVVTLVVINTFCVVLKRGCPKIYSVMMGQRGSHT